MKPSTIAETAFLAYLRQIGAEKPDSLRVYRQLQSNTRAKPKSNPVVAHDTPDVIVGYEAVGMAIGLDITKSWPREQLHAHLKAPFDPLPARWTIRGLQVFRPRLELWCQRLGHYDEPLPGLPVLVGMEAMAAAAGVSVSCLKVYLQERDGRLPPPITRDNPSWCYEEALKDWVMSLTISFPLEARYSERLGAHRSGEENEAA